MRIVGQPPLEATVFEMERLRCNACGEVFTAEEPLAAGPQKYDPTAVAMIAYFVIVVPLAIVAGRRTPSGVGNGA